MARTTQTARLSTGNTAKRVSLTRSTVVPMEALADVNIAVKPSIDLQVSAYHVMENL
jgi:hypothetical protein